MNSPTAEFLNQFAIVYLAHSSLLLVTAWLIVRFGRIRSHVLRERTWKSAAVLGLLTVTLQFVAARPLNALRSLVRTSFQNAQTADHENPQPVLREFEKESGSATPDVTAGSPLDSASVRGNTDRSPSQAPVSSRHPSPVVIGTEFDAPYQADNGPVISTLVAPTDRVATNQPAHAASKFAAGLSVAGRWLLHLPLVFLFAGCLLLIVKGLRLCRQFPGASTVSSGPVRRILDRLLRKSAVTRRITLKFSDECAEPLACGLLQWTIVLPTGIENHMTREQLRALLAHEVAHLVRRDLIWLLIGKVLCTCFAFQPLNFVARRSWQTSAEHLCDDWAVGKGNSPLVLAQCLAAIVEWRIGDPVASGALAARGSHGEVVDRVRRLLDDNHVPDSWERPRRKWALGLITTIVALVVTSCGPRLADGKDATPVPVFNPVVAPRAQGSISRWQALDAEFDALDAELDRATRLLKKLTTEEVSPELAGRLEMRRAALKRQIQMQSSKWNKQ